MKKHILLLSLSAGLLIACSPQGMQGHPAAIQAGAAVGGVLGSIVGDRAGGYYGSQFGALIGTVAGVAVGNAVSTPRPKVSDGESLEPRSVAASPEDVYVREDYGLESEVPAVSSLRIQNLRFIDANRNQVIDAQEDCKLVFDLVNEGEVPAYHILPVIEEVGGMKHLMISSSAQISYMEVGNQIRYTATIRGGRRLKSGKAQFRVYATESTGAMTEVHSFSLPTQKRIKK